MILQDAKRKTSSGRAKKSTNNSNRLPIYSEKGNEILNLFNQTRKRNKNYFFFLCGNEKGTETCVHDNTT